MTSSRSFRSADQPRKNLLAESTSTSVDTNSNWGGIESLNVPQTKSQAEKDAEVKAQAEANAKKAQQEAAASQQRSLSVSRSASRSALPSKDAPASASGQAVLDYATTFLGIPYKSGGNTPDEGFDCSGFTRYVYAHFGINLPRIANAQRVGQQVSNPSTGDLMVAKDGSHVAIYISGGSMIHAPQPGQSVKIQAIYNPGGWDFYRVL
ncbi:hypothetical protein AB656_04410 [Bifidobacterium actinocoloniiforme DSM 22766]|nr:hypothetical protein AB656_04410 [Bifidobacterium actinocoloniiforme DSM 22766]